MLGKTNYEVRLCKDFIEENGLKDKFKQYVVRAYADNEITINEVVDLGIPTSEINDETFISVENLDGIEVYYTGGGVWIAQKTLPNGDYFVVTNDFPTCLTMYSKNVNDELFLADDMLFSADYKELTTKSLSIYNALYRKLSEYCKTL